MTNTTDALTKRHRRAPWIVGAIAAVAIGGGAVIGGPSLAAQLNPAPTPTVTAVSVAETGLSDDELAATQDGAQAWADQKAADEAAAAAEVAAQAKAAADAQAAADAAKAAANKKATQGGSAGGPHCPSGTSMTQGDANGDPEWCLPTSCFGANPGDNCTTPIAAIKP